MTVRELINSLLEFENDKDVNIYVRCSADTMKEYDTEEGECIDQYIELEDITEDGNAVHIIAEKIEY